MANPVAEPRILILRGGAIGDFICTVPALAAVRNRWPESHVELVGYPHIAELGLAGGLADKVRSLDSADIARYYSSKPDLSDSARQYLQSFDLIITYMYDPDGTVKRNMERTGARRVVYGCPLARDMHACDHLMKPLETLAVYPEGNTSPRLAFDDALLKEGKLEASRIGTPVVAIHPGSGSARKNWPADRYIRLAGHIKALNMARPVFLAGDAEHELEPVLRSECPDIPVISGMTLVRLGSFLPACACYVGNDSGITHLAAAVGVPVIALYGPTDPRIWGPRGNRVNILKAGNRMSDIDVQTVTDAVSAMMGCPRQA